MTIIRKYQFIWWGLRAWRRLRFIRFDEDKTDLAFIYDWSFHIGPLEIRKWIL